MPVPVCQNESRRFDRVYATSPAGDQETTELTNIFLASAHSMATVNAGRFKITNEIRNCDTQGVCQHSVPSGFRILQYFRLCDIYEIHGLEV
jgi:hypothetical protein